MSFYHQILITLSSFAGKDVNLNSLMNVYYLVPILVLIILYQMANNLMKSVVNNINNTLWTVIKWLFTKFVWRPVKWIWNSLIVKSFRIVRDWILLPLFNFTTSRCFQTVILLLVLLLDDNIWTKITRIHHLICESFDLFVNLLHYCFISSITFIHSILTTK